MYCGVVHCKGTIVFECDGDPDVEYRPVVGFPMYAVGDDGSVWSCGRGHIQKVKPRMVGAGYCGITLRDNGKARSTTFHVLVLEAFVGPCPPGMNCRHLDGVKTNNRVTNLKWGTNIEQAEDKRRHGTLNIGTRNGQSKLTDEIVRQIKQDLYDGIASQDVADKFNITQATVNRVANNTIWKHVGGKELNGRSRRARGEKSGNAKLTTQAVTEIYKRAASGEMRTQIAKDYGVTSALVGHIANGRAWTHVTRHLPDPPKHIYSRGRLVEDSVSA